MTNYRLPGVKVAVAVVLLLLLSAGTAAEAADRTRPITVRNPDQLPATLPAERIDLKRGYKPNMARLPSGELVMTAYTGEGSPTHYYSWLWRSTDSGQTWSALNDGLLTRAVRSLALSRDGSVLYMTSEGAGVFRLGTPGR